MPSSNISVYLVVGKRYKGLKEKREIIEITQGVQVEKDINFMESYEEEEEKLNVRQEDKVKNINNNGESESQRKMRY
jgi:hypothetical protein